HSDTNRVRASEIYLKNRDAGNIAVRPVTQLFDPEKGMFLSDRFIKGTCPKCKVEDQYGDSCEVCGATYNATELLNPHSTLSGATPVEKSSDHYFFKLPNFGEYLQKWTRDEGRLPVSIANKLDEWFENGLNDWDIERDVAYSSVEIVVLKFRMHQTNTSMYGSMRQSVICRALKTTSKPNVLN